MTDYNHLFAAKILLKSTEEQLEKAVVGLHDKYTDQAIHLAKAVGGFLSGVEYLLKRMDKKEDFI